MKSYLKVLSRIEQFLFYNICDVYGGKFVFFFLSEIFLKDYISFSSDSLVFTFSLSQKDVMFELAAHNFIQKKLKVCKLFLTSASFDHNFNGFSFFFSK